MEYPLLKQLKIAAFVLVLFMSNNGITTAQEIDTEQYSTEQEAMEQDSIEIIAKDTLKPRWGAFFDYGLNMLNANFTHLPGTHSCCTNLGWGFTPGFSAGALFEYPFTEKFRLNLRGGFNQLNSNHLAKLYTSFIINGASVDGVIDHKLESRIAMIDLDIMPSYAVMPDFYITAGIKLGYIIHNQFMQVERISEPNDPNLFFEENGLKYRNYYRGDIQDINKLQVMGSIGLYYDFALNRKKTWYISPEIYYSYSFNKLVKDVDWSAHLIRGGIAVKYQAPPPPPPPPPLPAAPPMPELPEPIAPPALAANVNIVQLDSAGNTRDNIELKIEDFVSRNMRPLLNYVFFDNNSYEIPSRYFLINKEQAEYFNEMELKDMDVIPTYYYVYNILGKRMQQYPNATITLTGTNSNEGDELNNKELSTKRAETVRDYFVNVWGIDQSRIKVKAVNLPSEPSNSEEVGGNEENRRVEITADDPNLTEPVLTIDTIRKIPKTSIVFHPQATADAGIKKWELSILQSGQKLKTFSGEGEIPQALEWVIDEKSKNIPTKGGNLTYFLNVQDKLGNEVSTKQQQIKVDQLTIDKKRVEGIADKEFEFYSLILFDYGKSKLGVEHKKTADFVKKRITDKSNVTIIGYTDSMGREEVNKRISTARANEFAKRINIPKAQTYGVGEESLLYDNSLPEGRFYCRTVKVNIETPIEN